MVDETAKEDFWYEQFSKAKNHLDQLKKMHESTLDQITKMRSREAELEHQGQRLIDTVNTLQKDNERLAAENKELKSRSYIVDDTIPKIYSPPEYEKDTKYNYDLNGPADIEIEEDIIAR